MKFKLLLAFITVSLLDSRLMAEQVNVHDAQMVALNFFRINTAASSEAGKTTAQLNYTGMGASGIAVFYVFDIKPKGFVIVTADDNITPVIAYSTESDFHSNFNRVGVKDWMENTTAKIANALNQHTLANSRITYLWNSYINGLNPGNTKGSTVAPLLSTTWDQETYYNQLCPYNDTDKVHCVTGCVATAMAQVMKFWNYPANGSGSYSYDDVTPAYSHNYGEQSASFENTIYTWPQMPAALSTNNNAVATLMYQCGVSVAMNYGDDKEGGSAAYVLKAESGSFPCAQQSYINYFSYDATTIKGVFAAAYTSAEWGSLLESELNAGRPVQYEGQDPGVGGHTWICDGYETNGMFHMNWGWGGYDNGYFSMDSLAVAGANFSSSEAALIGIQPGKSQATGVNNIASSSFKLYPNPAAKYINVEFNGVSDGSVQINIYSMAGKKVVSEKIISMEGLNTHEFNVDRFASGIYILEIENSGDITRQKFTVGN